MRIALLSPPWFPVPPRAYGGIETIVHLLAEGLVERGVDVTLFASGDSTTAAELDAVYAQAPSDHIGKTEWDLEHVLLCLRRAPEFDLVHDHAGPLGMTLLALAGVRVVSSVHGPLTGRPGRLYARACRMAPGIQLVSLSLRQRAPQPSLPWLANVPNAIDTSAYPFSPRKDDYLLFLGRMGEDKGAHRAIEIARAAGLPLRIAAKCRDDAEIAYFEREIEPRLGPDVCWHGEVGGAEKLELLSRARALVFPIAWEEPFGLVMVEAMACGTPVLATRRGSVPEVVAHGVSGFVAEDEEGLAASVPLLASLDPERVRAHASGRFSAARMVDRYVAVYEAVVDERVRALRRLRAARTSSVAGA